ncbi:hypothetical protein [Streptomyces sp. NPDC048551]|uniref:hypothetical protein n=1 Tax=Streptomyces sp. NPDC048551 TaxID=3155758 RepID=UPI0034407ED5
MRPRLLPVVALSAVLLTAGCDGAPGGEAPGGGAAGGGAPTPSAEHAGTVRAAVEATGRTSARLAHTTEMGDGTTTYTITGAGDFDLANDRGNLSVELAGTRTEEVFADGKVYVRGATGPARGVWLVADRDAEARHLLRPPANDPEFVLRQVSMVKEYAQLPAEDVNGVRAVHYRGVLPDEAISLRMTKDALDKVATMRTAFGSPIPALADVWVDPQGRAVRARVGMEIKNLPKTVTTVGFSEFGKAVRVTPPAGEETEASDGFTGPAIG